MVTTEESSYHTVKIWDVSNLSNVELVGEYLGSSHLAHNVQVKGRYVFISHYEAGITVIDIADPTQPVEVTKFDTYPAGESPAFHGCWGAYPYAQNGMVYASDIEGYLTILQFDSAITGVRKSPVPGRVALAQNHPNPFNNSTTIGYQLPIYSDVTIKIYNLLGQNVRTLVDRQQAAGRHTVVWDGRDDSGNAMASGVYFYRLTQNGISVDRKLMLLK